KRVEGPGGGGRGWGGIMGKNYGGRGGRGGKDRRGGGAAESLRAPPSCRSCPSCLSCLISRDGSTRAAVLPWRGATPQRLQVLNDRAHLRVGIPTQFRIRRLRIIGPELRHSSAGQERRRVLEPRQQPVRIQPVVHHAQIGREVRRRLILRNLAEDMALLALQLLEQRLAGRVLRRRDVVGAERLEVVRHGLEVVDGAVETRVVQSERR